jgi:hypothetical protein
MLSSRQDDKVNVIIKPDGNTSVIINLDEIIFVIIQPDNNSK